MLSVSTPIVSAETKVSTQIPKSVDQAVEKAEEKTAIKASLKVGEAKKDEKVSVRKLSGDVEISALRRMWPEVIENVKKRRRLTWSLLSTSAQIISLDDEVITIGIVNVGAKDSFIRSESDLILSHAFEEVTGVRKKIAVTVDSSISARIMERNTEAPDDLDMLSGVELVSEKLGAKIINSFDEGA